jgi:hypothetical protein
MADWQVKRIKVRVEHAVQAPDDDLAAPAIAFDPYEVYQTFSVASADMVTTDQPDNVAGEAVLCLKQDDVEGFYTLHRLEDAIPFDFDTDVTLEQLQGALKVEFTYVDQDTGAEIMNAAYYPIGPLHDFAVAAGGMPNALDCVLVLKRTAQDPPAFKLVYIELGGADAAPICTRLQCKTTKNIFRRLRCARLGCYRN